MQPQLSTSRSRSRQANSPILELDSFLFSFAERHGRNLQPRARRQTQELIEVLVEFLEDRGVTLAARHAGRGVVSRAKLLDLLDDFEASDMVEVFGDQREAMRTADAAMRALTRTLRRAL